MNTFKNIFSHKKAFVAYITAGHNGMDYSERAALALIDGGVDILEIGVPFSDPVADGPVIQQAMQSALALNTSLEDSLILTRKIKQQRSAPIVLFSYYNPLLSYGFERTFKQAVDCGVDAMLIVDLPFEEADTYFQLCKANQIHPISLIAPSTPDKKIKILAQQDNGFLYYVCRNGTTGVKDALPSDYTQQMQRLKSLTDTPIVSGFGISNRTMARQATQYADGFVVGSAIVAAISDGMKPIMLKSFASNLHMAISI